MRAVVIIVVFETILAGLFVGAAGRWDLPWFWTLLGIHTVVMGANMWVMDPDLKKERLTLGRREGMDRSMRRLIMPFVLLHLVVAALDVGRFGWSGKCRITGSRRGPAWILRRIRPGGVGDGGESVLRASGAAAK